MRIFTLLVFLFLIVEITVVEGAYINAGGGLSTTVGNPFVMGKLK